MTKSIFGLLLLLSVPAIFSCTRTSINENFSSSELDSLLLQGIDETQNLQFEKAYETLFTLLNQAENQNSIKHQIRANLNIGVLYLSFSNHNEALNYFFECLRISEEEAFPNYLNSIYNNIGLVYAENNSYQESLNYYQKAIDASSVKHDTVGIGMNLVNIGVSYKKLERYNESRQQLTNAQNILLGIDRPDIQSELHQTLGAIDFIEGDLDNALHAFKRAYEYAIRANYQQFAWEAELNQGKTFLAKGSLDSAEYYTRKSLVGFDAINNRDREIEAYEILGEIALAKKEYDSAKQYFLLIVSLKDSLLMERKVKWVNESQINYEIGKKNAKIESLESKAQQERTLWLIGIIITLIVILLVITTMRAINKSLRQRNVILKQEKQVTELEVEKNQAVNDKLKQTMLRQEEISQLEKQRILDELEHKNRELVSKAMHLVNKNETLTSIQSSIAQLKKGSDKEKDRSIKEIEATLRSVKGAEDEWQNFRLHFEEVHPDFFRSLTAQYPDLNLNDQRMCAYFKLGLAAKEIAQILNISPDSIRKRKQRLKEKLNFESSKDLLDWLK